MWACAEACIMHRPNVFPMCDACATLADWATDSNVPVQLVYD